MDPDDFRFNAPAKNVCEKCVEDGALAKVVRDNVAAKRCDYCGKRSRTLIAASMEVVIDHMSDCIECHFTDPANELPYESAEGGYQGKLLDAWDVFEELGYEPSNSDLYDDCVEAFNGQTWCRVDYFRLTEQERLEFSWDAFKKVVKHERRFTFWSLSDEDPYDETIPVGRLLSFISRGAKDARLVKVLPKRTTFWRVRVHAPGTKLSADHELSPPPLAYANQSNRMSPAGVPMFYGADDFETAVIETVTLKTPAERIVTGAAFRSVKELRILDLAEIPAIPSMFDREADDARTTLLFLRHFSRDVSIPILDDSREHVEYAPTQAFTEYVRYIMRLNKKRIDGIRYRSSRNGRPCYVLFCAQDECVDAPSGYKVERWLRMDETSLTSEPVADAPFTLPPPSR